MNVTPRNPARGFSLIEVLIAVIVLSFGLLALAALQARLIQSSSETKAQSVALNLAKDKLEELRAYRTVAPAVSCAANPDSYRCINSSAAAETLSDTSGSLGGVNFTRTWTVRRYAVTTTGTNFTQLGTANNTGALPAGYVPNNEFKTVEVRVTWTDAQGTSRSVAMEDAIAGLDPQDSARNQRNRGTRPRGPEVLIYDPSSEAGVIPIAIGSGSSTAATNPKPVNVARTGDDAVETRFDVLTYAALTGGKALAQARVETTMVGCTCTNASTSTKGYRPTYWNGYRYVPPVQNTTNATARAATGTTQSRYCDECCRDHHDTGFSGPKFSPRRAAHTHYKLQAGSLVPAGSNDNYLEACRLIRVDGIFDVAADLSNDYFNLLQTGSGGNSPAPSSSGVSSYQDFVLDYLQARYVSPTPSQGSQSAIYNNRTAPAPATYASAAAPQSLDEPAEIAINASGTKWLHSRGLYVDYLETEALDAITDAKANCQGTGTSPPTAAQLRECVLRTIPFTSINLTELSEWTPAAGTQIKVTNDDFSLTETIQDPIRGKVTPGTSPTDGQVTNAVAKIGSTNSGVAIFGDINPDEDEIITTDVNGFWNDLQAFRVGSSSGPPGGTFRIGLGNYAIAANDRPNAGFTYNGRDDTCSDAPGTNPIPCATLSGEPLPVTGMPIRVGNYNKAGTDTVVNACWNNHTLPMPYRVVYDVTGFSSTNASASFGTPDVENDGMVGIIPGGEYTTVTVSQVAQGDVITATMSAPTYLCPANYPGSGHAQATCTGNGSNAVANWSTTYVNCPVQTGPPDFAQ